MQRLALALVLMLGCAGLPGVGRSPDERPAHQRPRSDQWYESNAPLVREYLAHLPESAKGKPLAGIPLSDGSRRFEGDVYRGRRQDLAPGLTVVLIEREGNVVAYFWLEEGSEPLPLEACEAGEDAGIRAYRLGGAAYAWRSVAPEHGILYTTCPPADWVEGATSSE